MAYIHEFRPVGYIRDTVPEPLFSVLKERALQAKDAMLSASDKLAGNIAEEYDMRNIRDEPLGKELFNFLASKIVEYNNTFEYKYNVLVEDAPYCLGETWVNFQKKGEFNPNHTHPGIYAYVIWVNIPYSLEEELKNPSSVNSNNNIPSTFQFIVNDFFGQNFHTIKVDKSYEGQMIFFPASMAHTVYPFFTSDDYRISIAGNICLK